MNRTEKKIIKGQHTEITDLIHNGEKNAVTARDLAAITGLNIAVYKQSAAFVFPVAIPVLSKKLSKPVQY